MKTELLRMLDQRLTEHHETLSGRIDDLAHEMRSQHRMVIERLDAHEQYHRHAEHRWGLLALARRHPLRLAALAFLFGALAWPGGVEDAARCLRWLHHWIQPNLH